MFTILKPLWMLAQSVLVLAVCGWAVDYYDPSAFDYHIPEYFYHIVLIGVFGVSVFWLLCHLVGGSLFGMAAGGFMDGIKLGLILGGGMAVSRLWPYGIAWGVGCIAAEGPLLHSIVAITLGVILLVVQTVVRYFWSHQEHI